MQAKIVTMTLALLFSLFLSTPCFAHKVRIFAWSEGDTIHTESKFSGGKPAQKASVSVIDHSTGKELLSGVTDKKGLFQFPAPQSGVQEINIIVNSGDGHKNNWLYQLEEASPPATTEKTLHQPATESAESLSLTREELKEIIDTSLDKKLAPIQRQLAEQSEQGPNLKDILGGIGYILGLAGIAAYMKSKKQ